MNNSQEDQDRRLIDALFDFGSQVNLIATFMASKLGLEVHDHPIPYPLGWINKDAEIKVTNIV
jgi:hypothetical protein